MSDGESDDDDWYNQMDQMAQMYGDNADGMDESLTAVAGSTVAADDDEAVSEEEYFSMMSENNMENCFLDEGNMVWQGLARKFLSESTDRVSQQASRLQRIFPSVDACTFVLLQQWLFTFLPHSLKSYAILANASILHAEQRRFYIDNKLHPSLWAATNYHRAVHTIEIILFAPYKTYEPCKKFFLDLLLDVQQAYPGVKIKLTGMDAELFEMAILPLSAGANRTLHVQWVESCTMHVFESKWSIQQVDLPDGYGFKSLTDEDSEIINDTWKYKSSESIHMVRRMVSSGKCLGIHFRGELACWCLSYDEGSLGMLYTLQDHRQKGLAKKVVVELINRLFGVPGTMDTPMPFCYIEISNQNSKNIFNALGFIKCADVVWVGLEYLKGIKS